MYSGLQRVRFSDVLHYIYEMMRRDHLTLPCPFIVSDQFVWTYVRWLKETSALALSYKSRVFILGQEY